MVKQEFTGVHSFTLFFSTSLMQNKAKVVVTKFLVRIACRLHRPERRYRRFLINVNPLKLVYMKLRVYLLTLL